MATTLGDLKLRFSYRVGEDAVPSSTAEVARRVSFINEGYRDVIRRQYWWFTEATAQFNSVQGQESYGASDGVPSNMRQILELRYQDRLYSQITQADGMQAYTLPYNNYSESYFLFDDKLFFVPALGASVTNGIKIKYYANPVNLASDSDQVVIPDIFSDVLVSYAYGRWNQQESERGSAGDGFAEYTEIIDLMTREQNKYLFSLKSTNTDVQLVGAYP